MSVDEPNVFGAAKPVTISELNDDGDEKVKPEKTSTSSPEEGGTGGGATSKRRSSGASGTPAWHLSLTLGLVIALVGGLVLWLQSPTLAIIVVGAIVVLVGLGLALRHFFGQDVKKSDRGGQVKRSTGGASQNRTSSSHDKRAQGSTGPTRQRGTTREGDAKRQDRASSSNRTKPTSGGDKTPNGREPQTRADRRRQRREDRVQGRDRQTDGKGRDASATGRDRSSSARRRDATNGGNSAGGEPRNPTRRRRGPDEPNLLGGPNGAPSKPKKRVNDTFVNPPTPFKPAAPRPLAAPQKVPDPAGTTPPKVNPPTMTSIKPKPSKTKGKKLKTEDKVDQMKVKVKGNKPRSVVGPSRVKRADVKVKKSSQEAPIAWPNVDLDKIYPSSSSSLRITAPRRAVRLPPQRREEPQWPTRDPDQKPVPPQPDKRGKMATPDMLTRAERERHYSTAASVALKSADDKDHQSNQFLSLAGDLDGVEGLELVREEHYQNAAKSAYDAEVRRSKATIYSWLMNNN